MPGVMAGASLAVGHDSQGAAAGLVSASQGIGFIVGPVVSTMLYEWDKALPFWILAGLMALLATKFAIVPLRFPQFGDAEG
jgi:MFS family permease